MKIGSVTIKNFRSISSSNFAISGGKVALMGGNESGKSNVLLAIKRFLDQEKFSPEDKYQLSDEEISLEVVFQNFTDDEKIFLGSILKVDNINSLTIKRTNDVYEVTHPAIPQNESEPETANENEETEDETTETTSVTPGTQQTQETSETPAQPETETSLEGENKPAVEEIQQKTQEQIQNDILAMMPKAISIKTVDGLIKGKNVPLSEIFPTTSSAGKKPSKLSENEIETVKKLLELGGIIEGDVFDKDTGKRNHNLATKAAVISEKLSTAWHQEKVEMRLTADSQHLAIEFKDCGNVPEGEDATDLRKEIWTYPEDRSDGFRWFITFYTRYLYGLSQSNNAIFLIDEAGGALNKKAQQDLLKEFDKMTSEERNNQIIYASHSKYMGSWDFRNDIYAVLKIKGVGTDVTNEWLTKFTFNELPSPLDELGLYWMQDFVSDENFIVEGPTDLEVLRFLATKFQNEGIPQSPFRGYRLVPGMGVHDSMIELASACVYQKKKVFLMFDSDIDGLAGKARAKAEGLKTDDLNKLCGSPTPPTLTIEDLLPRKSFINFLNESGKEKFGEDWHEVKKLQDVNSLGILKAVEQRLINGDNSLNEKVAKDFIRFKKYGIVMSVLRNLKIEDFSENQRSSIVKLLKNLHKKLSERLGKVL